MISARIYKAPTGEEGETMLKLMKLRTLALATGASLCAALGAVTLFAPAASAALSFAFDGQLAPASGSFGRTEPGGPHVGEPSLNGLAINDFNGETYVAEQPNGEGAPEGRLDAVDVFDSTGSELAPLGAAPTPAGSFGDGGIAVAANNATGEVYVLDSTHEVVDVFDSTGGYVCQITGAATPSLSECNGPAGSDTPAHGFLNPRGIAIDQATGELYVLDAQNGVVDVFSVAGAFERQIELGQIPGGLPSEAIKTVAVSSFNGDVFVGERAGAVGVEAKLQEFDAAGVYVTTWTGENTPGGSLGHGEPTVAVEDNTGNVYVSDTYAGTPAVTDVFDSTGAYLTQFSHSYHIPRATAVGQASGKVYVSDAVAVNTVIPQVVDVFGPGVIVPDVTTLLASNVEAHTATLNGIVNPDEKPLTDCRFEYGPDASYGHSAPCVPTAGSIPSDGEEHQVTAEIVGLQAGTTYHFRLLAANAAGSNTGSDETLSTLPGPAIDSTAAENLTGTSAELTAEINPEGAQTSYRFEWGATVAYGNSIPVPDGAISAQVGDLPVRQRIGPLSPSATYHWRVVAANSRDTTTGVDHSFSYSSAAPGLPDGRAYEIVTPPEKNGALVGTGVLVVPPDISPDGERVMAVSVQCFAESQSCTAARQDEGEPYSFTRTSAGWQTTALAPPPTQVDGNSVWLLNAGAGTALFSISTPPGGQDDFYAREPDGALVHIGPVTPPANGALGPTFGGSAIQATPDLSHVVFEAPAGSYWPFDTTLSGMPSLYELAGENDAAPGLVGLSGTAGSPLISACGTQAVGHRHAMSLDGSTVYFTALSHSAACQSGVTAPLRTELYARIDESRTVAISQRSSSECTTVACRNSPSGDAEFENASADGSKAFFTDTQQLTDGASEDSDAADSATNAGCAHTAGPNGCNLYEYVGDSSGGHNVIAVSAGDTSGLGPEVQRVMAVSDDGSHVYFVARGVLTEVANDQGVRAVAGGENMYVYVRDASHPAGHLAFIASLAGADREESANNSSSTLAPPNVTPDGRFLVFTSHGDLTADDDSASGASQVFRYDAQSEQLARISIGEHGFNDNGNTFQAGLCEGSECAQNAKIAAGTSVARRDQTMSDDGSYVFFESPVGLTPDALNDVQIATTEHGQPTFAENVYEYHDGHVSLISDGKDTSRISTFSAVELLGSDRSGANVFFSTADQLVSRDTDTQRDYYDARICTAASPCIPPTAARLPPCLGETCHGTPAAPPLPLLPASAGFSGAGNVTPAPHAPAKPKVVLSRAQTLAKALRACRTKRSKRKRAACEAQARRRYGTKAKSKRKNTRSKSKGGK
jgi:hypothetical protein